MGCCRLSSMMETTMNFYWKEQNLSSLTKRWEFPVRRQSPISEEGLCLKSSLPGIWPLTEAFAPYTYVCREIKAAPGHMLSAPDFEFQFEYKDERTKILNVQHDPENDSNRVKVEKQLGDTENG